MYDDADLPRSSRYDDIRALVGTGPAGGSSAEVVPVLQRLCQALVSRMSATGAAINLMSADALAGVAAAADAASLDRAELEFATGEGPCHDAHTQRRPVLVPDLARTLGRWPGYTTTAMAAGTCAVFAFPLRVGGASFGVLEIFNDEPGSLDDDQVADALTFAQLATDLLIRGQVTTADGDLEPGLASAMDARAEIHQAQGMLMVSMNVTLIEALVLMRSYAFSHDKPLIDVAKDVLLGHLLDDDDDR